VPGDVVLEDGGRALGEGLLHAREPAETLHLGQNGVGANLEDGDLRFHGWCLLTDRAAGRNM